MPDKNKILAICGSTRASSTNINLIKAIQDLAKEVFVIEIFEGLSGILHFNPDLDNSNPPVQVTAFRDKLKQAEGILICTPEYAMGVPGSLKNAIDWTVSSCEFSHKPTTLITASSSGVKGHASLLDTLKIIEAEISDETQLLISYCKTKISNDCKITDEKTLKEVKALINSFVKIISAK
jgi:chromate reductase